MRHAASDRTGRTNGKKYILSYAKKRWKVLLLLAANGLAFNLYYVFLMGERDSIYLYYLDLLLAVCGLLVLGADFSALMKKEKRKEELLTLELPVYQEFGAFENDDIAQHDVLVLKRQLEERYEENRNLQDYVAKWCHEFKIPLAAALLMVEEIQDTSKRSQMRAQLEKMRQQVNAMLSGCRLQGEFLDLKVTQVNLAECVKTAIRNNRFFLIQGGFELDIRVEERMIHTDREWVVYLLDQLLGNAVKYVGERPPKLCIWTKEQETGLTLFVEDHGVGILPQDIRRIFEKGYTGSNYHNGKYKSTGMGLYMADKIASRLGYRITAESEPGQWSRFGIVMEHGVSLQKM